MTIQVRFLKKIVIIFLAFSLALPAGWIPPSYATVAEKELTFTEGCKILLQRATGGHHKENSQIRANGTPQEYVDLAQSRKLPLKQQMLFMRFIHSKARKLVEWLIRKNKNYRGIPALYIQGNYDALIVTDGLLNFGTESDQYKFSTKTIEGWLEKYKSIDRRLIKMVEDGFSAKRQSESSLSGSKKNGLALGPEDFNPKDKTDDGNERLSQAQSLPVEYWENGELKSTTIEWLRYTGFVNYTEEQRIKYKDTFTHSNWEEINKNSDVYSLLVEQSILRRLLTLVYMEMKEERTLAKSLNTLLSDLKVTLDDESLMPRADVNRSRVIKELRAEIKYLFDSNKKITKSRKEAAFELSENGKKALKNSSIFRFMGLRYIMFATAVAGSVSSALYWQFVDRGPLGYTLAAIDESTARFIRENLEATGAERSCAAEVRAFNFGVCSPNNAMTLLGTYITDARSKGITDPNAFDEEYVNAFLTEYMFQAIKLRAENRSAQFFALGSEALNDRAPLLFTNYLTAEIVASYKFASDKMSDELSFEDALSEYYSLTDDNDEKRTYDEIVQNFMFAANISAKNSAESLNKVNTLTGINIQPLIDRIQTDKDLLLKEIPNTLTLPETTEEFIRNYVKTQLSQ